MQTCAVLQDLLLVFKALPAFEAAVVKTVLLGQIKNAAMKIGEIMPIIRVAITGLGAGPDLAQSMELIGREECTARMETFLAKYPLL